LPSAGNLPGPAAAEERKKANPSHQAARPRPCPVHRAADPEVVLPWHCCSNPNAAHCGTMRVLWILALLILLVLPASVWATDRTCSTATTLDGLVACIRNQMPGSASNGFVIPTATQQTDWRWTMRQMLGGSCDFPPPASLAGIVQVKTFA